MYPLKEGMTFLYNQWYVAAWADEIDRKLFSRRILDQPIVFYRTENGEPIALRDRCPHRAFPLSKSRLIGDSVQCAYHGFTFREDGACTRLPTPDRVPPPYRVHKYPLVERWKWIWIWMGDPALADATKIPDHDLLRVESPGWMPAKGGVTSVKSRYTILHENLLDLSHLTFLHEGTVGSNGIARTKMELIEKPTHIEIIRDIKSDDLEGVPLGRAFDLKGLVDRYLMQQFFAPSFHTTGSTFHSARDGGDNPGHYFGGFRVLHGVTPETLHTTHYFYGCSRDFKHDDPSITDSLLQSIASAIAEDEFACEAVESMLTASSKPSDDIHSRADGAALRGRLILEHLMEEESAVKNIPTRKFA